MSRVLHDAPSPRKGRGGSALLASIGLLAACSGGDGPPPADRAPAPADTAPAPPDSAPEPDSGAPLGAGVGGHLVDFEGSSLPYTDVLCCTTIVCLKSETDGEGFFSFDLAPGTAVALKTHPELFALPRRAAALEPALAAGDRRVDAGELYVPDLPPGVPLGDASADPQTLSIGDGLELTLSRADLIPEPGAFLYDLAARKIPAEHRPDYPALDGEAVEAVYALHPFATASRTPVAIRAPSDLPAGTRVRFRAVSHLDGALSEPAEGTADGVAVATLPGEGVSLLTHLVISIAEE